MLLKIDNPDDKLNIDINENKKIVLQFMKKIFKENLNKLNKFYINKKMTIKEIVALIIVPNIISQLKKR